tara:strand:- start:176 stop:337 length:162 start_codon:yes stop_codon:yes gene_type:complete
MMNRDVRVGRRVRLVEEDVVLLVKHYMEKDNTFLGTCKYGHDYFFEAGDVEPT